MVHGILIPADDARSLEPIELHALEDYQRAVGGWIEAVDIGELGLTIYVNEEGLLRGLPFNRRGTFLWWYHVAEARGKARLVGDAVLVGWPDSDGQNTDLPVELRSALLAPASYAVSVREPSDGRWHASPLDHEEYIEAIVWAALLMEHAPGLQVRIARTDHGDNENEHHR